MDAGSVENEGRWDSVRLKDLPTRETDYGSSYQRQVINQVSPHILQCKCTRQLLPHLVRRNIITDGVCARIFSQSESEGVASIDRVLKEVVAEPGRQNVIGNLYLALLDCYEESVNEWCRTLATSTLRRAVISELKQVYINYFDLRVVLQCVQSVQLGSENAALLKSRLHLTHVMATDLWQIIQHGVSTTLQLSDLVMALLMTPSTGKYVAQLCPYCCCNAPYVYEVLLSLERKWTVFASHLGYSQAEIDAITRAGGSSLQVQIRMFLRVWWMPDCGENEMRSLLHQVIQEKLAISVSQSLVHIKDDGHSLLKACLENDWHRATTLIKEGSHLGARSEEEMLLHFYYKRFSIGGKVGSITTQDGRTPLMYACLKGQDSIVQLLIDHGADPQVFDKNGDTCLNFPETLRNRIILECILKEYKKQGVSVDIESLCSECTPLSIACKCRAVASAELLLDYGANPDGSSSGKHRPLVEASAQGHVGLVKALLNKRADVNTTGKNGITPLLQACTSRQWGVAQVLMDAGADVNMVGTDMYCTSPLFAAVSANSYSTAVSLIKKGANIDATSFQPGNVEGIVELSPLASAASKGLTAMVKLLMDYGANVNYLCANTLPAIAYAVINDHVETFHALFDSPNLVKSITGLSSTIITSVRVERYYYTQKLLEHLGGAHIALMVAQENQMTLLTENIVVYMQAVNHPQLSEVGHMPQQFKSPAISTPQVRLRAGDQQKIDEVLTRFSNICLSAILESPDIHVSHQSLVEIAQATGNPTVADFLRRVISSPPSAEEVRIGFLQGTPSPLRFLIENKILTIEIFQVEVLKFHPEDSERFYDDLVWTFQHMNGGAELPTNIHAMLTQLFSGRFTPRQTPRSGESYRRSVSTSAYQPSLPAVQIETKDVDRTFKENLMDGNQSTGDTGRRAHWSGESEKDNAPLPQDKSKSVQNVVANVENNMSSMAQIDTDAVPVDPRQRRDTAKVPTAHDQLFHFQGVNRKLSGITSYSTAATNTADEDEEMDFRLPNCRVKPNGVTLGHGAYGDVLEVEYKGKVYAAKKYRIPGGPSTGTSVLGAFSREHEILARIRHRNIVPYYGICRLTTDSSTVIVMQRMDINLNIHLEKNPNIPPVEKLALLYDITNGLDHLHSQKPAIIHRDLTAGNVLLNLNTGVAKISDFGNSRMVDLKATPELMTSSPGTLDYMSPEALEGGAYDEKIDIFSFGHLAVHIVIQRRPHPLQRPTYKQGSDLIARTEVQRRQVYLDEVKRKLSGGATHPLYSIMISCLQDEPDQRPSCKDIVSHSIFSACSNNTTSQQ